MSQLQRRAMSRGSERRRHADEQSDAGEGQSAAKVAAMVTVASQARGSTSASRSGWRGERCVNGAWRVSTDRSSTRDAIRRRSSTRWIMDFEGHVVQGRNRSRIPQRKTLITGPFPLLIYVRSAPTAFTTKYEGLGIKRDN
ncbi:hypothetical protein Scep_026560 [Stephania cephalantha]|uniref:Uncharacterized protein n=1 Tax=Stephania cephalantha TaxID=152367 RepID=A0AAP0EKD5_9MAGN